MAPAGQLGREAMPARLGLHGMFRFRMATFGSSALFLLLIATAGCASRTLAASRRGPATLTAPAAPSAADTAAVLRSAAELVVLTEQALRHEMRAAAARGAWPDSLRARAVAAADEPLAIGEIDPPAAAGAREALDQLRVLARPGPGALELRLHLLALDAASAAVRETRFSPCSPSGGAFAGRQRTLHFARREGAWVFVGEREAFYVHGRCVATPDGAA